MAGVVVAAIAAGLQLVLQHAFQSNLANSTPSDVWQFFSSILFSLQTAAGLVLAVGLVGLAWSVAAERGLT